MTATERQEIISEVIASLIASGKTIEQLTPVSGLSDDDKIEINDGRYVAFSTMREAIGAFTEDDKEALLEGVYQRLSLKADIADLNKRSRFMGIATPEMMFQNQPADKSWYLAGTQGNYPGFGGATLAKGEIAALVYSNGTWSKHTIAVINYDEALNSKANAADVQNALNAKLDKSAVVELKFIAESAEQALRDYPNELQDHTAGNRCAIGDCLYKPTTDTSHQEVGCYMPDRDLLGPYLYRVAGESDLYYWSASFEKLMPLSDLDRIHSDYAYAYIIPHVAGRYGVEQVMFVTDHPVSELREGGLAEALWRKFIQPGVSSSSISLNYYFIAGGVVYRKERSYEYSVAESLNADGHASPNLLFFCKGDIYRWNEELREMVKIVDASSVAALETRISALDSYKSSVEASLDFLYSQHQAYGVVVDESVADPDLERVGDIELHKSLPVQSLMRRCLLNDDGSVYAYLDPNDSNRLENGGHAALDGFMGQVMVEIPRHWRRCRNIGTETARKWEVLISRYPFEGAIEIPKMYVSAWEATVDRTDPEHLRLASVINTAPEYRGGDNNAEYDDTDKSLLGMPVAATGGLSIRHLRKYASNRGEGWCMYPYDSHMALYWLYVIEYATLNSQKAVDVRLANGLRKGGLGAGFTTIPSTAASSYRNGPLCPCGVTVSLGNKSGQVAVVLPEAVGAENDTAYACSYRGIEHPFGHFYKSCDGIVADLDADGIRYYSYPINGSVSDRRIIGSAPVKVSGYIKAMLIGDAGYILPTERGASSSSYYCDNFSRKSGTVHNAVAVVGSDWSSGPSAGLACCRFYDTLDGTDTKTGTRLCFIPSPENN